MLYAFTALNPTVQIMVVGCCMMIVGSCILILANQQICDRFIRCVNALKQLLANDRERSRRKYSSKKRN